MLESLKFIKGAISTKNLVSELTHVRITEGRAYAYNGKIALSTPIALDLNVTPKAATFMKAIGTCRSTVKMHITPKGKLAITSGKFKAFVECLETMSPLQDPKGEYVETDSNIIDALALLSNFVSDDASKPWSRGVLLKGSYAYATDNISLIQYKLNCEFPKKVNIPLVAIKELLRIKDKLLGIQLNENTLTFHFEGHRWLSTQLIAVEWPDVDSMLNRFTTRPPDLNKELFQAIEDVLPFVPESGAVTLYPEHITTGDSENGASVEVSTGCHNFSIFHGERLLKLKGVAERIDFNLYPQPCPFWGENIKGIIIGRRS